jgi:hypothetical protein
MAEKPPPPPPGSTIIIPPKADKKVITYLWMPDGKGNLIKADASFVKKSFAKLPLNSQIALSEYLLGVSNRQPTDSARQNLWTDIVDGAIAAFKEGKKQSPWDVLQVMTENSPMMQGVTVNIIEYDGINANALLNKIAKQIGFDLNLITSEDRVDFLKKVNEEASTGKTIQRKATTGGYETVTTPSLFDPKTFTESFLWAKVNLGDTKNIPSAAIKQISNVSTLLKAYGINNLSSKEINALGVEVASGTKTIDDLRLEFSGRAQKLYPAYADRLKTTPNLTMSDIAEPIIGTLSKVWEMDANSFELSDPNVTRFLNSDVTGKSPAPTITDVYNFALNHPNREKTKAANEEARDAGVAFARVAGWGI